MVAEAAEWISAAGLGVSAMRKLTATRFVVVVAVLAGLVGRWSRSGGAAAGGSL